MFMYMHVHEQNKLHMFMYFLIYNLNTASIVAMYFDTYIIIIIMYILYCSSLDVTTHMHAGV